MENTTTAPISQKEYLKRYFSKKDKKPKKKKVKLSSSSHIIRSHIIDDNDTDDLNLNANASIDDEVFSLEYLGDEAPQIAGVVDERPDHLKAADRLSNQKLWKSIEASDNNENKEVNTIDEPLWGIDARENGERIGENKINKDSSDSLERKEKFVTGFTNSSNSRSSSPPLSTSKKHQKKDFISSSRSKVMANRDDHPSQVSSKNLDTTPFSNTKEKSRKQSHSERSDKKVATSDSDQSPQRVSDKKSHNYRDTSPPKRSQKRKDNYDRNLSPPWKKDKKRTDYDSDSSPPRRKDKKRTDHNSDLSPPRRTDNDDDKSPPRRKYNRRTNQDNDQSPPRRRDEKTTDYDSDQSPPRRIDKKRTYHDSDLSPSRRTDKKTDNDRYQYPPRRKDKKRTDYDIDLSLPRRKDKKRTDHDSDLSPPRRTDNDHDQSPPRRKVIKRTDNDSDQSPSRRKDKKRTDYGSDLSPPRRKDKKLDRIGDLSPLRRKDKKRTNYDSDQSPPRRTGKGQRNSDSDLSPPRKNNRHFTGGALEKKNDGDKEKRLEKTLDGKKAGLQDAKSLRAELHTLQQQENKMFKEIGKRNIAPGEVVVRDRKTGRIKDFEKERQENKMKAAKNAELEAKYKKWNKGLKQVEAAEERVKDALHEMSKPLARYENDADLDRMLREREREGDPMLDYIKSKQRDAHAVTKTKPHYEGSYPPNRFNLRPGHRWDGVDRSNGYESKWFENINARKALQEEAYKWSSEDL